VGADGDTLESLSDEIAAVPDAAAVKSEVVDALTDIHLDHVLAVDFDSAAPVGNATSFLRQLVENDSGTARFTTNSLEQGPGGGDATEAKQDTIISNLGTVDGKVDTMDTNVDDIETLLGTVDGKVDTMDTNVDDIETLLGTVDGKVDAIPDAAAIEAACDATIVTYQLDHLLHTEYAGSAASGTVMDDLLESDGGIYRFNANALEEGPSGGGAATLQNQVDMLANLATTDGKIDTMDTNVDDIETLLGTVDGKIDTMDTNVDDVETLLGTVDGKIDTMDTNVDDVETLLGTVDGKIDTADTAIDLIMDILEGDHVVDDNETPYEYLIKRKGTETVLVTKEMYELDDTNITAVDQIVSKLIEPA
jgi:archaellum component FlaC